MSKRTKLKPAVVLSAIPNSIGVVRGLGSAGVPVITVSDVATDASARSKYTRQNLVAPDPDKSEEEFVNFLLEQKTLTGSLLIPTTDPFLVAVARNKSVLEKQFVVACPSWDVVKLYIDKKYTYEIAKRFSIPAPQTLNVGKRETPIQNAEIHYPCLVKPCISHLFYERYKTKMFVVDNEAQMSSIMRDIKTANLEVVIQEYIPGPDSNGANYNAYFCDGEPLAEFTAKKIRSGPPDTGSPRVLKSENISEIIESGRQMLRAMSFNGYACVEFKKDERDGVYNLMEVNGRHNMSSTLALKCGINFPLIEYMHTMFDERPSEQAYKEGVYWIHLFKELRYNFGCFRSERYSLQEYFQPYFRPNVFDLLDQKDFLPFIAASVYSLVRLGNKFVGNLRSSRTNSW